MGLSLLASPTDKGACNRTLHIASNDAQSLTSWRFNGLPVHHQLRHGAATCIPVTSRNKQRHKVIVNAATQFASIPGMRQLADLANVSDQEPDYATRDVQNPSYVSRRRMEDPTFDPDATDEEGLPLVYNEERIRQFWLRRPGELALRWGNFGRIAGPWLVSLLNAILQGKLEERQTQLARDAVNNVQALGPTFVKLTQVLSIRPDVLPAPVLIELSRLQDNANTFPTEEARQLVEKELGQPIPEVYSEFSELPVAAASLAQVYRARLRSTGQEVAVKVQRPGALSIITKDLYVARRAVGVYERIIRRFTKQDTDYAELLSTFAEGLYTELDFRNEALNAQRMQELLSAAEFGHIDKIVIPKPFLEHTTRRVLTMEWVTGEKISNLPPQEIRELIKIGQETFLTQLLEIGFLHGDPHSGNLMKVTEGPNAGKLALLDLGLVAEIPKADREAMISATIHLANRDWDSLIDDFISLGFLPANCDRGKVIPVMAGVLTPYLKGGGAASINFQTMSRDLLAATLDIEFSVPAYTALLARSVASLEGIALMGDASYAMVAQAYPFVARKILRNSSMGTSQLLQDIVFDGSGNIKPTRLSALLQAALGYAAQDTAQGFVDLDALPEDGASIQEMVQFLLSSEARDLRPLLVRELVSGADLWTRDRARKTVAALPTLLPRLPFAPRLPSLTLPAIPVPGLGLMPVGQALEVLAPPLSQAEQIHLQTLVQLAVSVLGAPEVELLSGDVGAPTLEQATTLLRLLTSPSAQVTELQHALTAATSTPEQAATVRSLVLEVFDRLAELQANRAGVEKSRLFPGYERLLQSLA